MSPQRDLIKLEGEHSETFTINEIFLPEHLPYVAIKRMLCKELLFAVV
jgi:hypothetical protein